MSLQRQLPENKSCADCRGPSPRWASTNLGVFVCIACSGIHRKLGTHISQVRSITLDTWTPAQVARFQKLGNAKAAQYFEACLPADFRRPLSGDSTQIERFIREKYEQKRYITVENGGLGGGAPSHRSQRGSAFGMSGAASMARPGLGIRSEQPVGAYDDVNSSGRTATRLSYGGRFGASKSAAGGLGLNGGVSTGKFNSARGIGSGARPKNALQRAGTMKEIMNMGFSTQLASRAVEAGEGDLQRAVEWVLENSDAAGTFEAQAAKPTPPAPERNLLDFGDPAPGPTSAPKSVSNPAVKMIPLHSQATSEAPLSAPPKDDFADFADFGAFESALPQKPQTTTHTTTIASPVLTNGTGGLSGSLASLYARTPTTFTDQTSQGLPKPMTSLPKPQQATQIYPRTPTKQSPQQLRKPLSMSPLGDQKPGPGGISAWRLNSIATSPARTSPTLTSRLSASVTNSTIASKSPLVPSQPPAPPMQFLSVSETQDVPPPPDCPPPPKEPTDSLPEASVLEQARVRQQQENHTAPPPNTHNGTPTSPVSNRKKEQESEDPFAALSMMALSSASTSKKSAKKQIVEPIVAQKEAVPTPSTAPVADVSAGINLEDFFG